MPSVAEIVYFKASQAYKDGTVNLDGPLSRLRKVPGLKESYVGYQTEDPDVLFWVNVWATRDARDAFAKEADYAEVEAASRPAFASAPTASYAEFEDTEGPLGAKITEFVTFTLKEGNTNGQLAPLVQKLHEKFAGTPRFHGDSWGLINGKPNAYHGILGWDTVQAHWDAVSDGPLKELVDQVKLVADLWLVHAALERYSRE